ncbi:hypothetical protein Asp14428_76380 [Actinoplanes sp. NBRC 14428]|nr:hypothetical protein Asp14428_76380 [Actinoplanes sp. NBRC 14428]
MSISPPAAAPVRLAAPPAPAPAPAAPAPAPLAAEERGWRHCAGCGATVYRPRLARKLGVCPECGHHHRLRPAERIAQLIDEGTYEPAPPVTVERDVLGFVDRRPYTERLDAAAVLGSEAAVHGTGRILGHEVVVVVMDFAFLGGSMGAAVGEVVTTAAEEALSTGRPLVVLTASGGARMQEGTISLMQMAKTGHAFARLREAGVLSICVLTDPTFGGVTASFATLADILVAEPGALIGFAGPRVVEQTTGSRLPDGFQRAEYLLEHGLLDRVEPRDRLRPQLARLIALARPGTAPAGAAEVQLRDPRRLPVRPAWQTLKLARDQQRPTTLDYVLRVCDEFVELHGDRLLADDHAVVGGLASIAGIPVMLVGHQKGHDTREMVHRNFGMPHPEGYRKALRLMRMADRAGLPIVTLVDTQGAFPGQAAEERGQAWAISESISTMSELRSPVVAVITGEGGSGGALALAVANHVLVMENACYSVISPESCSTILFGDRGRADEVAESLRITAPELLRLGVVDGVVAEPAGGSQADWDAAAAELRGCLLQSLSELAGIGPDELRAQRHGRFRRIGSVAAATTGSGDE